MPAVPTPAAVMPVGRRLSHVRRVLGPLDWYLQDDHLLAANQRWFQRQYRRFYYNDIQTVTIWPNRRLWLRLGIEAGVAALAAWIFWLTHLPAVAEVIVGTAAVGMMAELALGHRANACITTAQSTFTAPLVNRWGSAEGVLHELAQRLPQTQAEESRSEVVL